MSEQEWIAELRIQSTPSKEHPERSQGAVAKRVGYSTTVINQVLKGTYQGDLSRVQRAVEGALLGATVECPVLGELARQRCIEYQRRPFTPTNPMNVALWRACPKCPNGGKR
jgi:hypothetical protein